MVSRKVAEGMNQMMQAVVLEGTGKRAQLDFTYSAGKTGTSSSYRDAWFMGFTGALVTGVWVGHDDFRPMHYNGGVTGGSLPAMAWHNFMSVAHTNRNIPPIPGLPLHPMQMAEQQRLAELKRTDPGLAQAQIAQSDAEEDQHHAGSNPGRAEAAGRDHAPRRRRAGNTCKYDAGWRRCPQGASAGADEVEGRTGTARGGAGRRSPAALKDEAHGMRFA